MTDCELLSKIIHQIGIIDEPACNKKVTIVVDTIGDGGSFVYDLGRIESVYKWNFDNCSNFDIKGFDSIKVVPLKYRFVHVEDFDLRISPPGLCRILCLGKMDERHLSTYCGTKLGQQVLQFFPHMVGKWTFSTNFC